MSGYRRVRSRNAVQGQEQVYDDNGAVIPDPRVRPFPTNPPLPANCGRRFQWDEILDGTVFQHALFFLGRGTFGLVYRCQLPRTNEVAAVKIQCSNDPTGHEEFLAEVQTLHAAYHPNVIELLGRCYGRRNRAIVYEFMANGSLDRHIFVNQRQQGGPAGLDLPTQVLDWSKRIKIALGVARGLVYLHEVLNVVHGDVKAGHILLDEKFVPKLSDFGSVTRINVNQNGDEEETDDLSRMKGTPGWRAPETENFWAVSTKSDVYSYGVLLFVLFTGRKVNNSQHFAILTEWFMREWTDTGYAPVDVALGTRYSLEGLNRIYDIARMCLNQEPLARPAMRVVVSMVLQAALFPIQRVVRRHSA